MAEWRPLGIQQSPGDCIECIKIICCRNVSYKSNAVVVNAQFLLRSWTAFHIFVESAFDNDMIPFAVPLRKKSASLTLLI